MECIQCNKPIKGGRADRKFCGEACRNEYHNAGKIREHAEIKKITLALRQNRRILKGLLGNQPEVFVPREALLQKGFDFTYHTHAVVSKAKGNQYRFCFNYGYWDSGDGRCKVVKSFRD
jgi:hypothetical protein